MDDRLKKLRKALVGQETWPVEYMFKFIVPNEQKTIDEVKTLFPHPENFKYKVSRNVKYVGISYKAMMPDAESIISVYEKASRMKDVISL